MTMVVNGYTLTERQEAAICLLATTTAVLADERHPALINAALDIVDKVGAADELEDVVDHFMPPAEAATVLANG